MVSQGKLFSVYRVHDDVNGTFMVAIQPQSTPGPFKNLHASGDFYTSLGVAVGSRIAGAHTVGKPPGGVRFAINDIFESEGLRTTAGNRALYSLSKPATKTCPATKRMIDAGAELLGTLKLGSLIAREEPTESVDYHASFYPRADGYQSAWSSSGGSGAAIASYDWIDFTVGTDTTGSSRRPAMANGAFQIRLTHNLIPLDNSVPSFPRFDSPAMYTRSILCLETWVVVWLNQTSSTYDGFRRRSLNKAHSLEHLENSTTPSRGTTTLNQYYQDSAGEMSIMDDTMIGRWLSDLPMDDPSRKSTSKPLLRRFIHHNMPIRYIEFLGGGGEGVVYRVEIAGNEYALKVFKNWTYKGRQDLKERERHYTSPIAHEARAFARLDSVGKNGTWAVKCHGWMKLAGAQCPKAVRSHSRWAIVKNYIPNPVTLDDVPEIRRKMRIARKALLYPEDAQPRNYRGPFLVDLGRVRTYPYPPLLWSDTKRKEYFKWFDEYASSWEVSVRDGSLIEGWVNEKLKQAIADVEAWNAKGEPRKRVAPRKRIQTACEREHANEKNKVIKLGDTAETD
ncbi:hypothetical protein FQN49_001664 [Arthroderma sp. PD_2]|nr:hypothetical protein FQN49_001664 [Arthroderma sp. PD_2]